jgi:hypothetical protein
VVYGTAARVKGMAVVNQIATKGVEKMDEKEWLEKSIKAVLKSRGTDENKLFHIMQLIESFEAMKEI